MPEPAHPTTAHPPKQVGTSLSTQQAAARVLRDGPIGAYLVAGIAVGLLLLGWLAFYFLLFLPRGAIG
jgi:hypothetical protein